MASHEIHIRPSTRADIPRLADIFDSTFAFDSLFQTLFPLGLEHPHVQRLRRTITERDRLYSKTLLPLVAVDSATGVVVGYACWELRSRSRRHGKFSNLLTQSLWTRLVGSVECYLLGWERFYFNKVLDTVVDVSAISAYRNHPLPPFVGIDDYMFLRGLAVAPEVQRRGVGAKLMQYGIDIAETDRLPIGLCSSQVAQKLYSRVGFKVVGYELVGEYFNPLMLYEPESMRGEVLEKGWRVKSTPRFTLEGVLNAAQVAEAAALELTQ